MICESGRQAPVSLRVNCTQTSVKDETPCEALPDIPDTLVIHPLKPVSMLNVNNSFDETVPLISCEFEITFNGEDLKMIQQKGVRLLLGGNTKGIVPSLQILLI